MSTKVVIVTGANKGIGFATVRGLCKKFDGAVYLTSRNVELGEKAVEELKKEGLNPKYHQLDITDKKSIETFRDYLKDTYGGLDILINNAGIAFKHNSTEPVAVQAEVTLNVNFFSLLSTCEVMLPILRKGGKIVNLSSSAGHLTNIPDENLRKKFKDPSLTVAGLTELMQKYVDEAKQGAPGPEWGHSSYVVSKVGVTALSFVQQRLLKDRDITVNAVHPGYVDTDMTSHKGPLTIDQGAIAPLFAALELNENIGPNKYIWSDKRIVDWDRVLPPLR